MVSYQRKLIATGDVLDEQPLDLPARTLRTKAVWWTVPDQLSPALGPVDVPGAAHAAEHASIGLLPLFATCDRWDIGGVSTALHADTGSADRLRVRRPPGRGRFRRARLRHGRGLAARHP